MVQISTSYLGGNAQDLEKTVAQPIEEQLIALDGMLYFLSSSGNDGSLNIQVTFRLGTNPDIATVQTQNRVNIAMPRLPPEVQRQGVTVKKVSTAFLTSVSLVSPDNALRFAVSQQLRPDQSSEPGGQPGRSGRMPSGGQPGLLHAHVGQSGQDGEARCHRDRCQQCHSGPEPSEPARGRSASRRRPLAPISNTPSAPRGGW